jgi:four helix bundle protein
MRDYKKYEVWQDAHEMTLFVYQTILPMFPQSEQFHLASQLKRAAYSVSLNIVEGCGRNTDKDFVHFLDISFGSVQEVEYCCLLAFDLKYLPEDLYRQVGEKVNKVKAKLINLIKSIRK